MNKKKILILGSNGFFGKNLKKLLNKEDYLFFYVEKKDINLLDCIKLEEYFEEIKPNVVIHCAGIISSSISNNVNNNFEILNKNIMLNSHILHCCQKEYVEKIILFSTYRLFPDTIHEMYQEQDIETNIFEHLNNRGYLLSKHILHQQIKLYQEYFKKQVVCLILPNVYGCNDTFLTNGRIIASLIVKIEESILHQTDIYINCHENTSINIIYMNDIVKIISECLNTRHVNGNIIVFNKQNTFTLSEITNLIKTMMNCQNTVLFNNEKTYTKTNIMKPNTEKFDEYFKEFQFTDLMSSLEDTISFYLQQQRSL